MLCTITFLDIVKLKGMLVKQLSGRGRGSAPNPARAPPFEPARGPAVPRPLAQGTLSQIQ